MKESIKRQKEREENHRGIRSAEVDSCQQAKRVNSVKTWKSGKGRRWQVTENEWFDRMTQSERLQNDNKSPHKKMKKKKKKLGETPDN
ncbi:hypothetical protein RUM43_012318 [Polyplax serrata]|uniref:Uncharacterized protein n=1 Tax=Polyplax serrata TaxID=468196 RepID=A0AAN8P3T2_POLSC